MHLISSALVAFALLAIFATYVEVAGLKGNRWVQAFRLLPIPIYISFCLSFTLVPALLWWTVLAGFMLLLINSGWSISQSYLAAKNSIPSTRAEWLRSVRYAPYIFFGLLVIYLAALFMEQIKSPIPEQSPAREAPPLSNDTLTSRKPEEEINDEESWYKMQSERP